MKDPCYTSLLPNYCQLSGGWEICCVWDLRFCSSR